jgi:hypothetical protein
MRQEPNTLKPAWVIVGYGRLGRTLSNILFLKDIHHTILRSADQHRIREICQGAERVLLCVPDSQIIPLLEFKNPEDTWLHFSATVSDPRIHRAHPMRSFDGRVLSTAEFNEIPFALDEASPPLSDLLPDFSNPYFFLKADEFQKYHALCVLAASLPVLIWTQVESELKKIAIPEEHFRNYIAAVTNNFLEKGGESLTGPWTRSDQLTVEKNLAALEMNPLLAEAYALGLKSYAAHFEEVIKSRSSDAFL